MSEPAHIAEIPVSEDNRAPVRFLWRTDPDGRFVEVSPELAGMVGKPGEIVGRTWEELRASAVDDPDGVVATSFARRETWNGQVVYWATDQGNLRVPVDFAGLPIFGSDRQLLGFRGFGLLRPDLSPEPARRPGPTPVEFKAGEFYTPSAIETRQGGWFNDMRQRLMAHIGNYTPPVMEQAAEAAPPLATSHSQPAALPVEEPAAESKPADTKLSDAERNAFREIARALGGRAEEESSEPKARVVANGQDQERIRAFEEELAASKARIEALEEELSASKARIEALEEELRAAAPPPAAEAESGVKAGLLAELARETRAPLDQIIAFSGGMLEERLGPLGSSAYKEYLKDVRDSAVRIADLIDGLAELATIEAGRLALAPAPSSLNDLISMCVAQAQPRVARERVVLRTSLAERLPSVTIDGEAVRQVATNLLAQAASSGGPGSQVIVSTALADSGDVVFRVRDSGRGKGLTDLSLARATALIAANGGKLTVTSGEGQGTLVEVSFPPAA